MLNTMKRGLFVGSVVAVVAALLQRRRRSPPAVTRSSASARAARGARGFAMFGGPASVGPVSAAPASAAPASAGPACAATAPAWRSRHARRARRRTARRRRAEDGGDVPAASRWPTSRPTSRAARRSPRRRRRRARRAAGLIAALTKEAKENLDAAVAAGWLTQKQADAVLEGVTEEITELVNNGPPVPPEKSAGPLDAAATYLGMTVADMHTALKGGKTLAQLVTAPKTVDGLVAALTADAKTKLDKAVADERDHAGAGERDPEQADRAGDRLRQRRPRPEGARRRRRTRSRRRCQVHRLKHSVRR